MILLRKLVSIRHNGIDENKTIALRNPGRLTHPDSFSPEASIFVGLGFTERRFWTCQYLLNCTTRVQTQSVRRITIRRTRRW
jgi:hypothetical protein